MLRLNTLTHTCTQTHKHNLLHTHTWSLTKYFGTAVATEYFTPVGEKESVRKGEREWQKEREVKSGRRERKL